MRPNARSVTILLGSLSLAQAAAHRRDGFVGKLRAMADEALDRRQAAAQTVTVLQTVTVGAADAGVVANNTVTVTVTERAAGGGAVASTVTVTNCAPGQVQGAISGGESAAGGASATAPAAGAVAAAPGAATPGAQGVPSGGIGVVLVSIPSSLRTPTKTGAAPKAPTAAPAAPPAASPPPAQVQNPAAGASSLAPLPGSSLAAGSSLQPLPAASSASSASSTLLALPSQGIASSLQPLPVASSSVALPAASASSAAALQPLPTAGAAVPPGGIVPPASSLDSTLNLGGIAPTPAPAPDGSFGGQAGLIPLPPSAAAPGAPQAAIDPAATITPGVAQAGAEVVNIDVSGLTLNSQLNLGNLAKATVVSATK